jgi:5-methyltetrahydrofolate--homocysteine methyltransferase
VEADYAEVRKRHANRGEAKPLLSLARSREKKFDGGWSGYAPPAPRTPGVTVFDAVPLEELRAIIDWTPFFQTWELSGRYPQILEDAVVGVQAKELFADAQAMLDRIVAEGWLTAKAVAGIWPANSMGDDVRLSSGESIRFLRQQADKPDDRANFCLADFVAPSGEDWIGGFAVNAGIGIEPHLARFEAEHDDYRSILLKSLADRLAEACAEWLHRKIRTELWGYAADEALDVDGLVREQYRGIRPAPGYPACPDHSEKAMLFRLLDAENAIGLKLTESFAMYPASSVSGYYFSHPKSQYFVVGRLSREQLADYAQRKGVPVAHAERWLAANLDYDPE